MKLNTENAKSFNGSLKQAFKEGGMNGVKVRIINSYKFPNCWVEVRTGGFSNDFRLRVFDARYGFPKRESLLNASDVSYGNIQKHSISAKVWEWEKVFNNEIDATKMAKGGSLLEQRIELAKKKSKVAKDGKYFGGEVYLVLQHKTDPEEIFVISQFNYNIDKHNNQWNDYNIVFKTNEMAKGGGVKKRSLMSMAHLVVADWRKEKIKDWYTKTYSTDELGEEINDLTFEDLWNTNVDNIYEVIGVGDSIIRERLFERLSEIYGVSYNDVYDRLFGKGGSLLERGATIEVDKYANGGGVGENEMELWYVMDSKGNVKNISKDEENAEKFLNKLDGGKIGYAVVLKKDYDDENITTSVIKKYSRVQQSSPMTLKESEYATKRMSEIEAEKDNKKLYLEGKGLKYANGGGVGEDKLELFYVMDNNGNVKNISKSYEKANDFLEKSLKLNGKIGYKNVLKSDWDAENINASNIKKYANGGGVGEDDVDNIKAKEFWDKMSFEDKRKFADKHSTVTTDAQVLGNYKGLPIGLKHSLRMIGNKYAKGNTIDSPFLDKYKKYGGAIKEADIKVGAKFELINGQIIEITRLFTENIDQDWCEFIRGGENIFETQLESSVNALKIFINNWRAEKKYGVGGTFDSSSTGEVIGGTLGSSESGETIGGTMASSYAKGGMVGYNPLYLLFNEGNSATIRLFSEDYHKGSGYYTAIGDLLFRKYQDEFQMSSIDMNISSDHNAPFKFKLMAKVSQFLKDKVGSYASVQEVLGVIGGEELIVADIGRNQTTFLPKSYIGYHVFEVVQKKDGKTYTNIYAPNTLKAQKMLDEKLKEIGGSGNYELHSTGDTVRNSRSEVKFKLGGNTASSYSYEIGGL